MSTIIIIALIAWWLHSYIKFRRRYSYFVNMVSYLEYKLQNSKEIERGWVIARLACAYQEIQKYETAYKLYETALQCKLINIQPEYIRINMNFCANPVPGVSKPKDFNCSYLHHFILLRLGGRRMSFLYDEDFLQVNQILRKQ